jgi:uncharacterized protein YjiS (DUF1127 family)
MRDTGGTIYRDDDQTEGAAGSLLAMTRRVLVGTVEMLLRWQELSMQRRRLLELDAHMLKDIGISRADAVCEANRPFWDHRVHWVGDRKPGSPAGLAGAAPLVCCQR